MALQRRYAGNTTKCGDTRRIDEMVVFLQLIRNRIIEVMKSKVASMIVKEARHQKLMVFNHPNEKVNNLKEINEVWLKRHDR